MKPLLVATALVWYSVVYVLTDSIFAKTIAGIVMINAFLCHLGGHARWDVFCNTWMTSMLVLEHKLSCRFVLMGAVMFMVNHHTIQSQCIHALFVQGSGALGLLSCFS